MRGNVDKQFGDYCDTLCNTHMVANFSLYLSPFLCLHKPYLLHVNIRMWHVYNRYKIVNFATYNYYYYMLLYAHASIITFLPLFSSLAPHPLPSLYHVSSPLLSSMVDRYPVIFQCQYRPAPSHCSDPCKITWPAYYCMYDVYHVLNLHMWNETMSEG